MGRRYGGFGASFSYLAGGNSSDFIQWLTREVTVSNVQTPVSLRAKQGRTLLSCCMPLLGWLRVHHLHGAQWKVEHLPFTS